MSNTQAHLFYPEMGHLPDSTRLVRISHNHGSTYVAEWSPGNDQAVRAFMRKNRVRPLSPGGGRDPIHHEMPDPRLPARQEKFWCLVSSKGADNLGPIANHELLLD